MIYQHLFDRAEAGKTVTAAIIGAGTLAAVRLPDSAPVRPLQGGTWRTAGSADPMCLADA